MTRSMTKHNLVKGQPNDYGLSGSGGYSYPADVWSWGVLVCELIGGFNPF